MLLASGIAILFPQLAGTDERFGDIAQMSFNSELGIDHSTGAINELRDEPPLRLPHIIDGFIHALFID